MGTLTFTDPQDIKRFLSSQGFSPKRAFDQNFLVDERVVHAIVDAAEVSRGDRVLEVGPGLGVVTQALLEGGATVLAVESDRQMATILRQRFGTQKNFTLVEQDIRRFNLTTTVPHPYTLISNLPYSITGQLLRLFTDIPNPPRRMVVMTQLEVAQRICARPGEMTILAVVMQLYGPPRIVQKVPPNSFWPEPSVTSAIVAVEAHQKPYIIKMYTPGMYRHGLTNVYTFRNTLLQLVRIGFSKRRQMLKNNLQAGLGIPPELAQKLLTRSALDSTVRAQELSIEDWFKLTHSALALHAIAEQRDHTASRPRQSTSRA